MKDLGYGAGYQYAHAVPEAYTPQDYLPMVVRDAAGYQPFYAPGPFGFEREVGKRLAWWRDLRARLEGSPHAGAPAAASPGDDADRTPGRTPGADEDAQAQAGSSLTDSARAVPHESDVTTEPPG
jgi:hypothetical protein